jgi:hypothetical protein
MLMVESPDLLVVIADFDVVRIPVAEHKANPPLVVYRYGVLSGAIALEQVEAIARRNPQTLDLVGRVERRELPKGPGVRFRVADVPSCRWSRTAPYACPRTI